MLIYVYIYIMLYLENYTSIHLSGAIGFGDYLPYTVFFYISA